MTWTRKSSASQNIWFDGQHRYEHWYRSNQVYFITARCRDKFPAFTSENAKAIFWDRFDCHAFTHGFEPWVRTLMSNHYHALGYLKDGEQLGEMMRKIHGSIAKLVNDLLPQRHVPFWVDRGHQDYFDGCIRDVNQLRRAYRYTYAQCVRHGICSDPRAYPHTRVSVELEEAVKRAVQMNALLQGVRYKRYQRNGKG